MSQNTDATEAKYEQFVATTATSKLVWGLKNKGGWANSHAHDDESVDVIPFWSDKASAKACARDDWKGYLPFMIPLEEFVKSWCVEMEENGVLAGINWDANMIGKEINGFTLAADILEQARINKDQ